MTHSITIIGTGKVAWHMASALEQAGHVIGEVYGRSTNNADKLCRKLAEARVSTTPDFTQSHSSLFIIAVSDDAIETVASSISLPDKAILVHTSGTAPMSRLKVSGIDNIGVFYPLQTFSKDRVIRFTDLPMLIEASNITTQNQLIEIAQTLGSHTTVTTSEDRKSIHLAAVFANNFTNHMIDIAGHIMREKSLDADLLKPLIRETVEKALVQTPSSAQTGPAVRGDKETMSSHMNQLDNSPRLKEIYRLISDSIQDTSRQ